MVTLALPTTTNLSDVYASADQIAIATLLANKAVERSLSHKLEDARDAVTNKLIEIMTAYKGSMTAGGAGASAQLSISENMKMLPVLILGLLKNVSSNNINMLLKILKKTYNMVDGCLYTGWNTTERTNTP